MVMPADAGRPERDPEAHTGDGVMTKPRRAWVALATAYFALAGLLALVMTLAQAWGVLSAGLAGCALFVGDTFLRFPVPPDSLGCTQRLDVIPIVLGGIASFILLSTVAWLIRRRGTRLARIVPVGAVAGVLVGLLPLSTVRWVVEFYRGSLGPVELGLGVIPLAWAVASGLVAIATWHVRARPASE